MDPRTLLASFQDWAGAILRRIAGRPPEPPSFEGLLDELFAAWPLDAVEYAERGEPLPTEEAA